MYCIYAKDVMGYTNDPAHRLKTEQMMMRYEEGLKNKGRFDGRLSLCVCNSTG